MKGFRNGNLPFCRTELPDVIRIMAKGHHLDRKLLIVKQWSGTSPVEVVEPGLISLLFLYVRIKAGRAKQNLLKKFAPKVKN